MHVALNSDSASFLTPTNFSDRLSYLRSRETPQDVEYENRYQNIEFVNYRTVKTT